MDQPDLRRMSPDHMVEMEPVVEAMDELDVMELL